MAPGNRIVIRLPNFYMRLINYSIDYLRIGSNNTIFDQFLENYFEGMSDNRDSVLFNQNNIVFEKKFFTAQKHRYLNIYYKGKSIIQIKNYGDNFSQLKYSITFYGAFFLFSDIYFFLNHIYLNHTEHLYVSRLDVCSDYSISIASLLKISTKGVLRAVRTNMTSSNTIKKNNKIQTMYFGDKTTKRFFVRVYDKKAELLKSGKSLHYPHYFFYKNVTRVETQFNIQAVKRFDLKIDDVIDFLQKKSQTKIHSAFLSTIKNKKAVNFLKLKSVFIAQNYAKTIVLSNNNKSILSQLDYAKRMLGYAKKLHNEGFDVLSYLQQELYKDKLLQDAVDFFNNPF